MKSKIFSLCILLGLLLNNQANAALINLVNASFENPYLEDTQGSFAISGWNVENIDPEDVGIGSHIENPGFASFYSTEIHGRNVLTASNGEIVSQTTNTYINDNTQYTLQVNIGNRGFSPEPWNGYLIQLWAGNTLLTEDNSTLLPSERSFLTTTIAYNSLNNNVLTGENLEIRLLSYNNLDVVFDNVTLDVTAVPLPASIWFFLSGLAGLVHLSARSKKSNNVLTNRS